MKKKFLSFIFVLCLILPCVFTFTACKDDNPPHVHLLTYVQEIPSTCDAEGKEEHYICSLCNKLFSDANGANEVKVEDLVIPASHTFVNGVCSCGEEDLTYEIGGITKPMLQAMINTDRISNVTITSYDSNLVAKEYKFENDNGHQFVKVTNGADSSVTYYVSEAPGLVTKAYRVVGTELEEVANNQTTILDIKYECMNCVINADSKFFLMRNEYGGYIIDNYKQVGTQTYNLNITIDVANQRITKAETLKGLAIEYYTEFEDYSATDVDLPLSIHPDHEHNIVWGENITDPGCEEEGEQSGVCECGYETSRVVGATGHSYSDEWSTDQEYHWHAATCEHESLTKDKAEHTFVDGVCSACGEEECTTYGIYYEYDYSNRWYKVVGTWFEFDLKKIIIPKEHNSSPVGTIEANAFVNCTNLQELVIPDSVLDIKEGALNGLSKLRKLTIPHVGNQRFIGSSYDKTSYKYTYSNNVFGAIFGKSEFEGSIAVEQKYGYTGKYINGVTIYTSDTVTYYLPKSLREVTVLGHRIPAGAFYNCYMIKYINVIGNKTYSIGEQAFSNGPLQLSIDLTDVEEGANNLGGIIIKDDGDFTKEFIVTDDGFVFWEKEDGNYLVDYLGFEKELTLPADYKGEKYILDSDSLAYNYYIETIIMPDGAIESIRHGIFNSSGNIKKVVLPSDIDSIPGGLFATCYKLEEIVLPFVGIDRNAEVGTKDVLVNRLFSSTANATYLYGVTSWYNRDNYKNYVDGYVPKTLKKITILSGNINYGSLEGFNSLTEIVLGEGVHYISANGIKSTGLKTLVVCAPVTLVVGNGITADNLETIYYKGTSADVGNLTTLGADIYYYSETEPTKAGNYWHYVDGVIVAWANE